RHGSPGALRGAQRIDGFAATIGGNGSTTHAGYDPASRAPNVASGRPAANVGAFERDFGHRRVLVLSGVVARCTDENPFAPPCGDLLLITDGDTLMRRVAAFLGLLVLCGIGSGVPAADDSPPKKETPATADKPTPEGVEFFEKKIRPVLVNNCYKCHSAAADKIRGGLSMETRDAMRKGGDKGPAVVPGDLKKSLVIEAIHQTDDRV